MRTQISIILLISLIICSSPAAACYAADSENLSIDSLKVVPISDSTPISIIGPIENVNPTSFELPFIPQNGDINSLKLPENITCELSPEDGYTYRCPVQWDLDSLDVSTPGIHQITGTLQPGAGYAFTPDVSDQAISYIMVTAPDMQKETLTDIAISNTPQPNTLPLGDNPETLEISDINAICHTTMFGWYFKCPVEWNWNQLDAYTPGTYTITGQPLLPEGFMLPEDFSGLHTIINIVAADCIDLSAAYIDPLNNSYLTCNWLYVPQNAVLQYSIDAKNWQESEKDSHGASIYGTIGNNKKFLKINLSNLSPDCTYYFRVLYDTHQLSNELRISVASDAEYTLEVGGKGGDWDGGDVSGTELPPAPSDNNNNSDINNDNNTGNSNNNVNNPSNDSIISGNSSSNKHHNSNNSTSNSASDSAGTVNAIISSTYDSSADADSSGILIPQTDFPDELQPILQTLTDPATDNRHALQFPYLNSASVPTTPQKMSASAQLCRPLSDRLKTVSRIHSAMLPNPAYTCSSDTCLLTGKPASDTQNSAALSSNTVADSRSFFGKPLIIALLIICFIMLIATIASAAISRRKGQVLTRCTRYSFAIASLILVSALCLTLNQYDNKYTAACPQATDGVLHILQQQISQDTPIYLTRAWEFYPDLLLTPGDMHDNQSKHDGSEYEMQYIDIGGTTPMSHSCATYHLTLELPERSADYALELTEIFSSCRLYVNDNLLLESGATDAYTSDSKTNYKPGIINQVLTFAASGHTEILLAVEDHSSVYSGMTYPMAFGNAQTVINHRTSNLIIRAAFVLLALLGSALALSFGLRSNRKRGILAFLICLCLAGIIGLQLTHSLIITSYQPWYTLQAALFYALLLLAVLFEMELCEITGKRMLWLCAPCVAGLLCILLYFGGAAFWSVEVKEIFSALTSILKWYTAAVLAMLTAWSVWNMKFYSTILLCGSTALTGCLIWDRLLPLYEPVEGMWFTEIGCLLLAMSIFSFQWLDAIDAHRFKIAYQDSFHQMQQRLSMQKEHYQQLSSQVKRAQEASHDLRHHMRTMLSMAEADRWNDLRNYLKEYEPHVNENMLTLWSQNPAADAVLSRYACEAKRLAAVYDAQLVIPPDLDFPEDELCILLGNLLENACEALARQKNGDKKIYLRGHVENGCLGLIVDNTFDGNLKQRSQNPTHCDKLFNSSCCRQKISYDHDAPFLSSKHEGFGLGLSSVATIANKYHGLSDFSADGNVFHASVLIPLQ